MTMFGRLQILAQFANIHYLHFALSQFAHFAQICTEGDRGLSVEWDDEIMLYSLKRCPSHNCHQRIRFQRVLSTI